MTTIYASDTSRCALCEQHIDATQHIGFYLVGTRAAIGYTLCSTCGSKARRGLPPDEAQKLDTKMAAEAANLGLSTTH